MPTMPDRVVEELTSAVRRALAAAADPERAPGMQAYLRSDLACLGVTASRLRAAVRPVLDAHPLPDRRAYERAVLRLWDEAAFREERYVAWLLTRHRRYRAHQDPAALDLYRHLVVTGAWWDLVDPVAVHGVGTVLRAAPAEVAPVVVAWAVEDDLWLRRTAVICQVGARDLLDETLLREVLEHNLTDSAYGEDFFVRKAVGWALRQHSRLRPDWVVGFAEQHAGRLSPLSRREALRLLDRPPR